MWFRSHVSLRVLPTVCLLAAACSGEASRGECECPRDAAAPAPAAALPEGRAAEDAQNAPAPAPTLPIAQPLPRCAEGNDRRGRPDLEELSRRALEAERAGAFDRMLACALEARRIAEDDAVAAHLQAEALLHLGRPHEAQRAFALALALAPHDPWVLAGAADLHANHLPPQRDGSLLALAYAERGLLHAPRDEIELQLQLHLLAAWARTDLGDPRAALAHAEAALRLRPGDRDARVAKGRALYELTRFAEAVQVLEPLVEESGSDAEGFHLLGLALERIDGRLEEAERMLRRATELDPEGHPPPVALDDAELVELVRGEVSALPERERGLLARAKVPVQVTPLPEIDDLRAVDPPLSPTAVGMFRGPPIGVDAAEPREILLFARNLRRAARNLEELRTQVRITLLHEIGHLAGEDEAELRARGLE